MLTKKIKTTRNSPSPAFLYWKRRNCMESREIKDFISIGREDSNLLMLEDSFVSRRHARIEKNIAKNTYILKDMGSQNGVFVNGLQVREAILSHNDHIQIGKTQFTFSTERYNYEWQMISRSENSAWNASLSRIPYLAMSDSPVLILGPSGTGKELIARMIHKQSRRNRETLLSINCSTLTENLIESELFGHKKGSYTGSAENRKGAFLTASRGTLFMDEIGDLPLRLQPKLLRAIEYKEIKPLGSDLYFKTEARIISATHQDLKSKAERDEFRKDLYFRLNVVSLQVPALRDRMEDFEPLFKYFCLIFGLSWSTKALELFKSYHWPGNIRELKNTVERAKALFPSEVLDREKALMILDRLEEEYKKTGEPLWLLEKNSIIKALKIYKGNQAKASRFLDIPKSSLHDKLKEYQINASLYKQLS